jgi:hypothetical protein
VGLSHHYRHPILGHHAFLWQTRLPGQRKRHAAQDGGKGPRTRGPCDRCPDRFPLPDVRRLACGRMGARRQAAEAVDLGVLAPSWLLLVVNVGGVLVPETADLDGVLCIFGGAHGFAVVD